MFRLILLISLITSFTVSHADVLRIGRTVSDPAHDTPNLRKIGRYVTEELGGEFYDEYEIVTQNETSLDDFIKLVNNKKIDMVIDSTYAAVHYVDKTPLRPFMLVNRSGSVYVHSVFISRKDSGINSIDDLSGKTIALADKSSTPFYYLPVKSLKEHGLVSSEASEDSVKYIFTQKKEDVVRDVYLKKADAGAVCSTFWADEKAFPEFMKETLQVIHESDSLPGSVLLFNSEMPEAIRERLMTILLGLNNSRLLQHEINDCNIKSFHKITFDWQALFKEIRNFSH